MRTKLARHEVLTRIAARSEVPAEKFMRRLMPGFSRHNMPAYDRRIHDAWQCVRGAYVLYDHAWDCCNHDIRDWKWPLDELEEGGSFATPSASNYPWAILLRAAVEMLRTRTAA